MLSKRLGIIFAISCFLLPTGAEAQERLIGTPTDPSDWPSFVAFNDTRTNLQNRCAGVLVGSRWVLTAPNGCLSDREDDTRAYIGATRSDPYDGISVGIDQVYHHPRYSNQASDWALNPHWNIALVRLRREVQGVPLAQLSETKPLPGSQIQVAGVGNNSEDGESFVTNIFEATIDVVPQDICHQYLPEALHRSFFCAWTPYQGPCSLDEGTGAFQNGKLMGVFNIIWDKPGNPICPGKEGGGVYAAVAPALPWIQSVMRRGWDRARFLDIGAVVFRDGEFNPYVWATQDIRSPQMKFSEKVCIAGRKCLEPGTWIRLADNPYTRSRRANFWMFGPIIRRKERSGCLRGTVRATFEHPHKQETRVKKFRSCPERF